MKRVKFGARLDWQQRVEELGFGFHSAGEKYWNEDAYYQFTASQVDDLEKATNELWEMCLGAAQYAMDHDLYHLFKIPDWMKYHIEKSWNEDVPAIYGRFDFSYDGKVPKLLEFNADTPTSLFEASVVQWKWLEEMFPHADQFNSIHERLVAYWAYLKVYLHRHYPLHFSCVKQSLEDLTTVEYMRDCAIQAGIDTKLVFVEDIGWVNETKEFVDLEGDTILNIFKLYPWEFMTKEKFGEHIPYVKNGMFWIEPSWKMLMSNKALLPILWKLYPDCPYLLPSYFDKHRLKGDYVKKPIFSREGSNVEFYRNGVLSESSPGLYGEEGHIYQQLCELPNFDGNRPVIGSWIIGQEAAGIGIRESDGPITGNTSRFVPHLFE
jgi:glutathionylspermidine synthase